jgi:hypothetical protein
MLTAKSSTSTRTIPPTRSTSLVTHLSPTRIGTDTHTASQSGAAMSSRTATLPPGHSSSRPPTTPSRTLRAKNVPSHLGYPSKPTPRLWMPSLTERVRTCTCRSMAPGTVTYPPATRLSLCPSQRTTMVTTSRWHLQIARMATMTSSGIPKRTAIAPSASALLAYAGTLTLPVFLLRVTIRGRASYTSCTRLHR